MPDFRVYCDTPQGGAGAIVLDADESHHLITVNRAQAGQPVVAFDGRGSEWHCVLEATERRAARLRILQHRQAPHPLCRITLAQAVPLGAGMEGIIRKATEIGTSRIIPLETERTQIHLDGDRVERKAAKWRTTALEAAKQCGNPWLPRIDPIRPYADFLSQEAGAGAGLRLVASLRPGARPLKAVLASRRQAANPQGPATAHAWGSPIQVIWLVGPEGDFTPAELDRAQQHGFLPVTLGPLVLRCETAALYVLSVTTHELGLPEA